jgi:hypothetical protein
MHDICPNSMSMARTKESLTIDAEDSLRENNTSLLNRNSRMCPVPPQGVLKGLNTSFAAAILRDPPKANQMRKEGRFGRGKGSNLFRRMTRARIASVLGIRNPPHHERLPDIEEGERERNAPYPSPLPKKRALLVSITYHNSTSPIWTPLNGPHIDVKHSQLLLIRAYFINRSVVFFHGH